MGTKVEGLVPQAMRTKGKGRNYNKENGTFFRWNEMDFFVCKKMFTRKKINFRTSDIRNHEIM